jgi:hypothetical protein
VQRACFQWSSLPQQLLPLPCSALPRTNRFQSLVKQNHEIVKVLVIGHDKGLLSLWMLMLNLRSRGMWLMLPRSITAGRQYSRRTLPAVSWHHGGRHITVTQKTDPDIPWQPVCPPLIVVDSGPSLPSEYLTPIATQLQNRLIIILLLSIWYCSQFTLF